MNLKAIWEMTNILFFWQVFCKQIWKMMIMEGRMIYLGKFLLLCQLVFKCFLFFSFHFSLLFAVLPSYFEALSDPSMLFYKTITMLVYFSLFSSFSFYLLFFIFSYFFIFIIELTL